MLIISFQHSAELMESRGNGHTFLHPLQRHLLSTSLLGEITLSEVNAVATELCEHLSHIEVEKGVLPAAVVDCAPLVDRAGNSLCFAFFQSSFVHYQLPDC